MRGFQSGLRTGFWLAAIGAIAFAGILALGSVGQPSGTLRPTGPLGGLDDAAIPTQPTISTVTSRTLPGAVPAAAVGNLPQPMRIQQELVGTEEAVDTIIIARDVASPFGEGGDPVPLDAPFGTNVQVENAAGNNPAISVAGGPGQDFYVAYQHPGAGNDDIRVAKSSNGGATWTVATIGPQTYNEKNPELIVAPPNTVYVFFEHEDPNPDIDPGSGVIPASRAFRYYVSTNGGASYALQTISTFPGMANFRIPGGSLCFFPPTCANANVPALPVVYVSYEYNCDATLHAACPAAPSFSRQVFTVSDTSLGTAAGWFLEIIWVGSATQEGFRGSVGANDQFLHMAFEVEVTNDASWDVIVARLEPVSFTIEFIGTCGSACASNDPVYGFISVLGPSVTYGGGFRNPTALGRATHYIVAYHSATNGGQDPLNWAPVNGGPGPFGLGGFEATDIEMKYLSLFTLPDLTFASFRRGSEASFWLSADHGATFSGPYRASDNPGTIADIPRSVDVSAGAGNPGLGFIDTRDGDNDPWFATLFNAAIYVVKKNPAIGGSIEIDLVSTPIPAAFIWNTGDMHRVNALSPEAGPPDTQYVWESWSDGGGQDHTFNVGSTTTILTANYRTQFWLTMTATIGGVTLVPGDSWQDEAAPVTIECQMPPPTADTQYAFSTWIGQGPGSSSSGSNPDTITMFGPIQEICEATLEYRWILDTVPTGLDIRIDGMTAVAARQTVWWGDGSAHTVEAVTPQSPAGPLSQYVFDQWSDGTQNPTHAFTAAGPSSATAQFILEYRIDVRPTPADCSFWVDGVEYTATQTFWFEKDTVHLLDVTSPQARGPATQYVFGSWSDGGLQAHTFPASAPGLTLNLLCYVEYRYAFDTSPPNYDLLIDDNSLPSPQSLWWRQGTSHTVEFVTVTMTPDSRRVLLQWSDANTNNPRSFSNVAAPGTFTAQTVVEYRYIVDTNPTGLTMHVDGVARTGLPYTEWWRAGSTHSLEYRTVGTADTQSTFVRWTDDALAPNPRTFSNVNAGGTFIAEVVAQYRFTFDTSPAGLDLTVDGAVCTAPCITPWWNHGTSHTVEFPTLSIPPTTRRVLLQWSDGPTANPRSLPSITGPAQFTAQTGLEYLFALDTSPTGLTLLVDTVACTTPCAPWFAQGSTHTVEMPPEQSVGAGARRSFLQWSDLSPINHRTFSGVSGSVTLTGQTFAEYLIGFTTTPAGLQTELDGDVVLTPSVWVREGSAQIEALTPQSGALGTRYVFLRWSDNNPNALRTITVSATQYEAVFKTQHRLSLPPLSPVPVTCYGGDVLVADCWFDAGASANVRMGMDAYENPLFPGFREKFLGWTGDATGASYARSDPIAMSGPKTVSANWQDEVLIKVVTNPSLPGAPITVHADGAVVPRDLTAGGWWIRVLADTSITVQGDVTSGGQAYKFVRWTVGSTTTTLSVPAVAPLTLTAEYRALVFYESPVFWVGLIAAIVGAILIAFFLIRRRKQEPDVQAAPATSGAPPAPSLAPVTAMPPPPPGAAGEIAATMECPSCGLTIPAKAGPCPICGAEVAPPAPVVDERVRRLEDAFKSGRISYEQYQANLKRIRGAS